VIQTKTSPAIRLRLLAIRRLFGGFPASAPQQKPLPATPHVTPLLKEIIIPYQNSVTPPSPAAVSETRDVPALLRNALRAAGVHTGKMIFEESRVFVPLWDGLHQARNLVVKEGDKTLGVFGMDVVQANPSLAVNQIVSARGE
jgi:hypothetical protein